MSRRSPPSAGVLLAAAAAAVGGMISGCEAEPAVTTITRPTRDRTLAVMVPQEDTAWFLKLSGPDAFVAPLEGDFTAIAESMTFRDGQPQFDLPEGWTREDGSGMRTATLRPSPTSPVEVTVIRLPTGPVGADEYVHMNYDRWRRELSLPIDRGGPWRKTAESRGELRTAAVAGVDATWFDIRGTLPPASFKRIFGGDGLRKLTVPDGWTPQGKDAFRLAIFDAGEGVEVTVSTAGGGLMANINRWRGQLGLEPLEAGQPPEDVRSVRIDGREGMRLRIDGRQDERPSSVVVGVALVPDGRSSRTYYVKMSGPREAVDARMDAFDAFLSSLQFG